MTCDSCGAAIADKAIVCYRCGAPTATPQARPGPAASRRSAGLVIVLALAAAGLASVAVWLPEEAGGRLPAAIGAGAAALTAGWRLVSRRPRA
jgi:hypothetical protein